jgi:hypothetical protein
LALAVPSASNVSVNGSVVAVATTTGIGVLEGVRANAFPELFSPPFLSWGNNNSPVVKIIKTPNKINV